ncbi:MAG: DUF86 domain-containing protein [Methylocystis sp.]|nr:DUF86 domain-containing protein [Methylocystis sp.]MBI3275072.1 DUF86 domain-containing protein [Methylocystis sp.]
MAPRKSSFAIVEILDEIAWIAEVTAGKSLADFKADRAARYIVERSIEIISEASRRIPAELKALRPEIDWRGIGDIGNALRHEYHATSAKIVWEVTQNDLPPLKAAVEKIQAPSKE